VIIHKHYSKITAILILDFFYKKLRRNVKVGGVSMFVVVGCLSRSGRAGYMKLADASRKGWFTNRPYITTACQNNTATCYYLKLELLAAAT
jgi:hypothetical protein